MSRSTAFDSQVSLPLPDALQPESSENGHDYMLLNTANCGRSYRGWPGENNLVAKNRFKYFVILGRCENVITNTKHRTTELKIMPKHTRRTANAAAIQINSRTAEGKTHFAALSPLSNQSHPPANPYPCPWRPKTFPFCVLGSSVGK